jgi:hypothetical protein
MVERLGSQAHGATRVLALAFAICEAAQPAAPAATKATHNPVNDHDMIWPNMY